MNLSTSNDVPLEVDSKWVVFLGLCLIVQLHISSTCEETDLIQKGACPLQRVDNIPGKFVPQRGRLGVSELGFAK